MLTKYHDEDGRIIAYCEWLRVGASGYTQDNGDYIWVQDLWVHESFRFQHRVSDFIDEVMKKVPDAKYCYFNREKLGENRLRIYTQAQMERRRMRNNKKVEV